jgi:cyclopropane-fatty-acyl-phospholipid synthase
MDAKQDSIMPILAACYRNDADVFWQRWRIFFMACAELFDYDEGNEWFVGHYLFRKSGR